MDQGEEVEELCTCGTFTWGCIVTLHHNLHEEGGVQRSA
jgi:hypothetical protein